MDERGGLEVDGDTSRVEEQDKEEYWKDLAEFRDVNEFNIQFDISVYSKYGTSNPSLGYKKNYRCRNFPRCPYRLQVFFPSCDSKVVVKHNSMPHNHYEEIIGRFNSNLIMKKINNDIKKGTALIVRDLRKQNINVSAVQISNFKQRMKKKKCPDANMDYPSLYNWSVNRSILPVSALPNTPFVVYQQFTNNNDFRIAIRTRRLLELSNRSIVLHIDSTFKVMYNGYPLTVCGITDRCRHFHPVIFIITVGESTQEYEFAFKSIIVGCDILNIRRASYNYVMADCADAISAARLNVFGDSSKRLFCWYHVITAIRKKLSRIKDKDLRKEIENQITIIQLATSDIEFINATNLFFSYWNGKSVEVDEFLSYFYNEFITNHTNWFEGAAPGIPSTNNGVESYNLHIKETGTLRKQELIGYFLDNLVEFIEEESKDRGDCSSKRYQDTILIERNEWIDGLKSFELMKDNSYPTAGVVHLIEESLKIVSPPLEFSNIKEYIDFKKKHIIMRITNSSVTCTCSKFQKQYKCKHEIALSVILKRKTFPFRLGDIKLLVKRKRGRPKNLLRALERNEELQVDTNLEEALNNQNV